MNVFTEEETQNSNKTTAELLKKVKLHTTLSNLYTWSYIFWAAYVSFSDGTMQEDHLIVCF